MNNHIEKYFSNLSQVLKQNIKPDIIKLSELLLDSWSKNKSVYICGNGGSAGNAIHIANDMLYGAGERNGTGIRIEALTANPAVITCLANDTGYENIFMEQIKVKANKGDLLIVLSGSGNSMNVIKAINEAKKIDMEIFGILGFDGGECKKILKHYVHVNINDMQICEDMQMIILHICMQWLSKQKI